MSASHPRHQIAPAATAAVTATANPSSAAGSSELARLISGRRSQTPAAAQLCVGTLLPESDGLEALAVQLEGGDRMPAKLAASCLLRPQAGDLLQLLVQQQRCWIVQVLERANPQAPLALHLGSGEVHLHAGALQVQADTHLHLQAQELHVHAETLQEKALRKQSDIQGWSTTRAAFVEVHAERQLNLFGGVTTLVSEALLKVDGAQIHMG